MNLDFENTNNVGEPKNEFLDGIPFIRVEFKVRRDLGETIKNKILFYKDKLAQYTNKKIILIFTHRSGFEGRYKPWEQFTAHDWLNFSMFDFPSYLEPAFQEFAKDSRIIFQIWNEPEGVYTGASVLLEPIYYGFLFNESYKIIKRLNRNSQVITAGFKSGAGDSWNYFKETGIINYDGFSLHLYVCGAKKNPDFKISGNHVEDHLNFITSKTIKPIFLTEMGVLDEPNASPIAVEKFAKDWLEAALGYKQIKAICWYAWGIGMHNGFGLGTNTEIIHTNVKNALQYEDDTTKPVIDAWIVKTLNMTRTLRSSPQVIEGEGANKLMTINAGQGVEILETSFELDASGDNKYFWKKARVVGVEGYIAFQVGITETVRSF